MQKSKYYSDIVVLVNKLELIKYHGLENLEKHIENIKKFNLPVVIMINKFSDDTDEDLQIIKDFKV